VGRIHCSLRIHCSFGRIIDKFGRFSCFQKNHVPFAHQMHFGRIFLNFYSHGIFKHCVCPLSLCLLVGHDRCSRSGWALLKKSSSLYANVWQSSQIFSDFFSLRKALIASPPSRSGSTPPPTARLPPRRLSTMNLPPSPMTQPTNSCQHRLDDNRTSRVTS
jgi:hypothetical protein